MQNENIQGWLPPEKKVTLQSGLFKRNLVLKIILVSAIAITLGITVNGIRNFCEAYDIGYTCAQDDCCEPGEYTEGGFAYWESNSFWIEQGYEEGYKKGARDYVSDNEKED